MTTIIHKNRKDRNHIERKLNSKNGQQYVTSTILGKLLEEREINELVSPELLHDTDYWIDKFKNYPEIVFYLDVVDDFVEFLCKNEKMIEATVYPKKRRGPSLKAIDRIRSKRISVYVFDEELETLENLANQEHVTIPALLRKKGLNHKISHKPAKLDSQAYIELSHAASNLNQITKFFNSHPEAIFDLDKTKTVLNDFRRSLIGVNIEDGDEG